MNEKYNTPNSGCCGRPWQYATQPKCGQNHCCFNEYSYKMNACIRREQPGCSAQAVIPTVTIESMDDIVSYSNAFVHVTSNNTTFYVDCKHTPILTWKGNVEVNLPEDITTDEQFSAFIRSFDLKEQFLYVKFYSQDLEKFVIDAFYFDKNGRTYWVSEFEEITEL